MPTPAEVGGDFSALPTQLHNPAAGFAPIPGNIITNPDPIGEAMAKLFPAPTPGLNIPGYNYENSASQTTTSDQLSFRVNDQFNDRDAIFGRFTLNPQGGFEPFEVGITG